MNYIYCDESCYLKNDGADVMVVGAIVCPHYKKNYLNKEINKIKLKYGLSKNKEIKWTKLSAKYENMYQEIIELLMKEDKIKIRILLVKNKHDLKYEEYFQTHNDWYNKMYYFILHKKCSITNKNKIFIDKKDVYGGERIKKLLEILKTKPLTKNKYFGIFQIDSLESNLIQGLDIFLGMTTYCNRFNIEEKNNAKSHIIKSFMEKYNIDLTQKTSYKQKKFKIFIFDLSKRKGENNEKL